MLCRQAAHSKCSFNLSACYLGICRHQCLSACGPSPISIPQSRTKWPQQVPCSFDVINWTHYYQEWFWFVGSPYAVRLSQNSQRCCKVNCLSLIFGWFLSRISALWVELKFFVAVWLQDSATLLLLALKPKAVHYWLVKYVSGSWNLSCINCWSML